MKNIILLNFDYEGQTDLTLLVTGTTKENIQKVIDSTKEILNSEDWEYNISDVELYEEKIRENFTVIDADKMDIDY